MEEKVFPLNNIDLTTFLPEIDYDSFVQVKYFPGLCRVCLQESHNIQPISKVNFIHNLTENRVKADVDLLSVLKQLCNAEVSTLDKKPQNICEFCIKLATMAFHFCQLFFYSNKVLDKKLEAKKVNENETFAVENTQDDNKMELQNLEPVEVVYIKEESEEDVTNNLPKTKKKSRVKPSAKFEKSSKTELTKKYQYENNIFSCGICPDKSFTSLDLILAHHADEHNALEYCVICKSIILNPKNRRFHYASHSVKSIVCKLCRLVFESEESLENHKLSPEHNEKTTLTCTICKKNFKSHRCYLIHKKAKHDGPKKEFICAHCGHIFARKENLKTHLRIHSGTPTERSGPKTHLCPHCGKAFITNFVMRVHIQRVHNIDLGLKCSKSKYKPPYKPKLVIYQCKECNIKYRTYTQYLKHCGTHPNFTDYNCLKCQLPFKSLKEYLEHAKEHPEFKCPSCPKVFNNSHSWYQHRQKHQGKYECTVCKFVSVSKYGNEVHMRKHTGERPNICECCGKSFRHESVLRAHIFSIHGTKPWDCHICGKKFMYNTRLKVHLRTHTGVKPFTCPYCSKKFIDTTTRHKHVKSIHPDQMEKFLEYKRQFQDEEIRQAETGF